MEKRSEQNINALIIFCYPGECIVHSVRSRFSKQLVSNKSDLLRKINRLITFPNASDFCCHIMGMMRNEIARLRINTKHSV